MQQYGEYLAEYFQRSVPVDATMQLMENSLICKHNNLKLVKEDYILTNTSLEKLRVYVNIKQSLFEGDDDLIERYQGITDNKMSKEAKYQDVLDDYNTFLLTYHQEVKDTISKYHKDNLELSFLTKNLLIRMLTPGPASAPPPPAFVPLDSIDLKASLEKVVHQSSQRYLDFKPQQK